MTPEKMNQAFAKCLEPLARHYDDQPPAELPDKLKKSVRGNHITTGFHPHDAIRHLKWMCLRGIALVAEQRFDKANRWLGFVQGALWMAGFTSIDEMKDWNRPDASEDLKPKEAMCVINGCGEQRLPNSNLCRSHHMLLCKDADDKAPDQFERTPDGHINNCALANGDDEENCQICRGHCPDRRRFG